MAETGIYNKTMIPSTHPALPRTSLLKMGSMSLSNSPDLNPIENLWQVIKNKVEMHMPQNIDKLKCFLAEEWEAIPDDKVKNLIRSMKNRCEMILEENGNRIPY
jgi:hypothetical protein